MTDDRDNGVRLNEYTKDEWLLVARQLVPGITQEEYDAMWDDFQKRKAEHERQRRLN